jgi:ribosomal protein L35
MFVCPTCNEKFKTEQAIRKHFLQCWQTQHPYHKSKDAPRSEDIVTREVSEDIANFFNSFGD